MFETTWSVESKFPLRPIFGYTLALPILVLKWCWRHPTFVVVYAFDFQFWWWCSPHDRNSTSLIPILFAVSPAFQVQSVFCIFSLLATSPQICVVQSTIDLWLSLQHLITQVHKAFPDANQWRARLPQRKLLQIQHLLLIVGEVAFLVGGSTYALMFCFPPYLVWHFQLTLTHITYWLI